MVASEGQQGHLPLMGDGSSLARNGGYDGSLAHPIHSYHLGLELLTAKLYLHIRHQNRQDHFQSAYCSLSSTWASARLIRNRRLQRSVHSSLFPVKSRPHLICTHENSILFPATAGDGILATSHRDMCNVVFYSSEPIKLYV